MPELTVKLGVKTDPIEYRFSYDWLFGLLAQEGVGHVQLGSFFELYQLPDAFFIDLRRRAEEHGVVIDSLFTAHRELGGFFRDEPGFVDVARRNFQRFIEVGGLLGARAVGSNPGAVMRDRMALKPQGVACYVSHMKELMAVAHEHGVAWLTIEPMSCLAEPPTLPDEIRHMAGQLLDYHDAHPDSTASVGYCVDVAHGYADRDGRVVHGNLELLEASLPYLAELHLKNTDAMFNSTFGFGPAEREHGIVDVRQVRRLLLDNAGAIPLSELVCYLEIGGPKLGRDYSDHQLEQQLRQSLAYLRQAFLVDSDSTEPARASNDAAAASVRLDTGPVRVSPSMMCADQLHLLDEAKRLAAAGVHMFHMDIMDGHFAPNLSMGLPQLAQLRPHTTVPFDVHLMVADNDFFVEQVAAIGVQQITVHAESAADLRGTLARIGQHGARAGVAINPATPPSALEPALDAVDYVLVMTVNPGFAGQKMVPGGISKIAAVRRWLDERGRRDVTIEVDGNVSFVNVPEMIEAGADVLVAGTSSLFAAAPLAENIVRLNESVARGLVLREAARDKRVIV